MTEKDLLYETIRIAFIALNGKKQKYIPYDMNALLKCADKQNIYPLVYYAIGELCSNPKVYRSNINQIGAIYFVRKIAYLEVIREMENNGINTILLKGYVCSNRYTAEHLRVNTDCDLFVLEKNEKEATKILEKKGYKCIEVRQRNQHHSIWKHEDVGILELHTKLVEDDVDFIWQSTFEEEKLMKHRIRVDSAEGYFYKLPSIEEWVFLFIHTLKHFLQTGLSIQMLFDLYTAYNELGKEEIQTALRIIDNSNYGKLWKVFYEYIRKYGARLEADVSEDAFDIITKDLLNSGWMGLVENSSRVTLYEASNKEDLTLKSRIYRVKVLLRRLFPEKIIMQRRYPLSKRMPYLLPYYYVKRILIKITQYVNISQSDKADKKIRKVAKLERLKAIDSIMKACK